jgi:hypothetical protein
MDHTDRREEREPAQAWADVPRTPLSALHIITGMLLVVGGASFAMLSLFDAAWTGLLALAMATDDSATALPIGVTVYFVALTLLHLVGALASLVMTGSSIPTLTRKPSLLPAVGVLVAFVLPALRVLASCGSANMFTCWIWGVLLPVGWLTVLCGVLLYVQERRLMLAADHGAVRR